LSGFHFPQEVLLVEIERRCRFSDCEARNAIGLTKPEAIEYRGFECVKCERWNDDTVGPESLPDTWVYSSRPDQADLKVNRNQD
jgi:hypothetical protein